MKTDITPDEAAYILARSEVRPGHAPSPVERSLAAKMRKRMQDAHRRAVRDRDPAILRLLDAGAIDPDCLVGNDADDIPPG